MEKNFFFYCKEIKGKSYSVTYILEVVLEPGLGKGTESCQQSRQEKVCWQVYNIYKGSGRREQAGEIMNISSITVVQMGQLVLK